MNNVSLLFHNLRDDWTQTFPNRETLVPTMRTIIFTQMVVPVGGHRILSLIMDLTPFMVRISNAYLYQLAYRQPAWTIFIRPSVFGEREVRSRTPLPSFGFDSLRPMHYNPLQSDAQVDDHFTQFSQQQNEENLQTAAAQARRHNDALPNNAGAKNFFSRGVHGYVETLRKSVQMHAQEIERLAALPETPEVRIALEEARKAHKTATDEFQEKLDNLEACMPESYLELLRYMVLQAIQSQHPLMIDESPTQELPLGLHGIGKDLETLRLRRQQQEGNLTEENHQAIRELASNLQQEHLTLRVEVSSALQNYLNSDEFKTLSKSL